MVEINNTAEELFQGVKSVLEEVHKEHPTSIEGYIQCGEYRLKKIHNKELFDAISRLGSFGKLILGYMTSALYGNFDHYDEFYEVPVSNPSTSSCYNEMRILKREVPMRQGEFDFGIIADDLRKLPNVDMDILKRLGTHEAFGESTFELSQDMFNFFGNDLGLKLLGLIIFNVYQKFIDEFETKASESGNYSAFRALVHRYPRPEPFDSDAVPVYRYYDDTPTEEEKKFVTIAMTILKCKAIAMYDKMTSKPLFSETKEKKSNYYDVIHKDFSDEDFSDIISVPYIGYFSALTSGFAKRVLDEQIKDLNIVYRNVIVRLYEAFKKYIDKARQVQISKEKVLISETSNLIKKAFDECTSIEEKLALARAYAFDKKSELVPNGKTLLAILGIKGEKLSMEGKILQYYILSMYYARPVLRYIEEGDKGLTIHKFNYNEEIRSSCLDTMHEAIIYRQKFEKLAKKMGVVLKKPDDVKRLYIENNGKNPLVEPILIAKYIENEGGVVGMTWMDNGECGAYVTITPDLVLERGEYVYVDFIGEYKPPVPDTSCNCSDWDLTYGV